MSRFTALFMQIRAILFSLFETARWRDVTQSFTKNVRDYTGECDFVVRGREQRSHKREKYRRSEVIKVKEAEEEEEERIEG